jgi:tetratricopeptide (TPR) repeat protein
MPTDSLIPTPRRQSEELLEAARRRGDAGGEAAALVDLGVALMRERDIEEAIATLRQAIDRAVTSGLDAPAADGRLQLALALLAGRQPDESRAVLDACLDDAQRLGDQFRQKLALDYLARLHVTLGRSAEAVETLRRAQEVARSVADEAHEADLIWYEAIQLGELGRSGEAIERAEMAIAIHQRLGNPHAGLLIESLERYRSAGGGLPGYESASAIPGVFIGGRGGVRPATADHGAPAGLLSMAYSAMKAAGRFIGSGAKTVAPSVREGRLAICGGCEHHTGSRCRLCGCYTQVKTWLPHERCPAGRWAAESL